MLIFAVNQTRSTALLVIGYPHCATLSGEARRAQLLKKMPFGPA
jgi:hypothetical protein